MNSKNNSSLQDISRRSFLKLTAGSAVFGAAVLAAPSLALAKETAKHGARKVNPVAFGNIPQDAEKAANASPLIEDNLQGILDLVDTIRDNTLRRQTRNLIVDPTPTFMQEYSSQSSIDRLYDKLLAQGLVDPSKIDAEHLLPPFKGSVQKFKTAPGSGYGSHHPYPGGLVTHVNANLHITKFICETYAEVFGYAVNNDVAIAAQALHDLGKPFVFQWQSDGSSLKEYTIAGQGAHHTISLAEAIYRGLPAEEIVAQACAHGVPSGKGEADVVSWLKVAAAMAGVDPVAYGLLNKTGDGIPAPQKQEGYIVHLGDHDYVLSSPAAQKSVALLRRIAAGKYGMSEAETQSAKFNHFRNYVGAQLSYMFLNMLEGEPDGYELAAQEVARVILK